MYMKQEILIPKFKKKELNPDYLVENGSCRYSNRFAFIWSAMEHHKINLTLTQIVSLKEYREKASYYASELLCLLLDEKFTGERMLRNLEHFHENFEPENPLEELVFKIFGEVLNEIIWIDDILEMEEVKL